MLFVAIALLSGWANAAEVLEEVMVTATKRASNLQDVAISVGVITDELTDDFQIKGLRALWESQLTDTMRFKASASIYHSDEYSVQPTQAGYAIQDSFTKYDARLAVVANDGRWEVGSTRRNLGDEMVIQHAYNIAGNRFQSLGMGRSYTLEGVLHF